MLKKIVLRVLRRIVRILDPPQLDKPMEMDWSSLPALLKKLRDCGVTFSTVIDVGASDGQWSAAARTVFPEPKYVLMEMNQAHQPALKAYADTVPGSEVIWAAAADRDGEVFLVTGTNAFEGKALYETDRDLPKTPAHRLDTLAAEREWQPPYLIKLDTHGLEAEIFSGADKMLQSTSVVVVEAYNIQFDPARLRFHQLCAFMEERGFRCYDVFDPMHRNKDGALWQFDMVFLRADVPPLSVGGYY